MISVYFALAGRCVCEQGGLFSSEFIEQLLRFGAGNVDRTMQLSTIAHGIYLCSLLIVIA